MAEPEQSSSSATKTEAVDIVKLRGVSKTYTRGRRGRAACSRSSISTCRRARTRRSWGPRAPARSTLLNLIAGLDRPTARRRRGRGQAARGAGRGSARQVAREHDRLRVPVVQPPAGAHGARERGAAAAPHATSAPPSGAPAPQTALRVVGPRGPHAALPAAALRRSGAARRHRPRHRQRSDDHRGRRAHGRSRSQERRRHPGAARQAQHAAGQDHPHGHPRSGGRRARDDHPQARQGQARISDARGPGGSQPRAQQVPRGAHGPGRGRGHRRVSAASHGHLVVDQRRRTSPPRTAW